MILESALGNLNLLVFGRFFLRFFYYRTFLGSESAENIPIFRNVQEKHHESQTRRKLQLEILVNFTNPVIFNITGFVATWSFDPF